MSHYSEPPPKADDPLLIPPPGISLTAFFEHIPLEELGDDEESATDAPPAPR